MGVDLISESGNVAGFGYGGWSMLLEIARRYGWEPQGTTAPAGLDAADWDSAQYESSDGQMVTCADAKLIAGALEKAVTDPELRVTVMRMDAESRQAVLERVGPELAASYVGVRSFDEYRDCLREFAAFCRQGAFRVE